jgi:hypothetical protein
MKLKRNAVKAMLVGAMSIAAVGFGAGLAHADPPFPMPPPFWAPWLPVWNTELNAWGVWCNGSFQTL